MNKVPSRLETERLLLRPLTACDARQVYNNWASDPAVAKFMRWNTHTDVGSTALWLTEWEKAVSNRGLYDWGIVLKEINEPIGSIGALIEEEYSDRYTFGYCIGQHFWGLGYMKEALKCVVRYMKEEVGIQHFCCYHAIENPASGAVMRSAGFRYVKDGTYQSYDGQREFACKIYELDFE